MKGFLSDVFRVGVSKLIIIVSGFATSIVVARVLGPEKNGIITSLLVYPTIFMTVGSLGVRQSVTFLLGKEKYSERSLKEAIFQIWILTSIVSTILCFSLIYFFSRTHKDLSLIVLAVAPITFSLFNTYCSGIYLGKNKISEFNAINWIPAAVTTVMSFLFLVIFKSGIDGYLISVFRAIHHVFHLVFQGGVSSIF
ncbi:oligosaccharide flippase family protein [Cyclobacterium xiamenense]|uniref:oligosaccharide flippase family protein n=1 Tax=Cyclobacterium xiamenense TaxID=1297121 RepID=UPI0035CF5FE6